MQAVALAALALDARCQPRANMEPSLVDEYVESLQSGDTFPPITVFRDGEAFWVADGFHRVAAATRIGALSIDADVFDGDIRDAILYSVGANAIHGMRRRNLDKRRAVETLLNDPEWSQWSDREIARRCAVHHQLVATVRSSLDDSSSEPPATRTYTDRYGNTSTMNVSNIGKTPVAPRVHGSVPADIMDDLFGGDDGPGERAQAPLPAAINWEEGDRKAADQVIRCRQFVDGYDAQRVAYAVAASGAADREKVMTESIELRLWLGELTHQLNKLK